MGKYGITPQTTLRDIYLGYLIAIDNEQFLTDLNLVPEQALAMRTMNNNTWGEFEEARASVNTQERKLNNVR